MTSAGLLLSLTLFEQTVERRVSGLTLAPDLSYVLLSAGSGATVSSNWPALEEAVPAGSLVKPFTARAALRMGPPPVFDCRAGQCWLPKGHGRIDLLRAIAHSCNAYFERLAGRIAPEQFALTARDLTGFGSEWRQQPAALAESYRQLQRDTGVRIILDGMHLALVEGTARGLGLAEGFAKTGTAPCSHGRGEGDGFIVYMDTRFVLLVRVHGVTGSQAAKRARPLAQALRP